MLETQAPDPSRPTVTTGEAARLLGCGIDTVKNRIKAGEFGADAGRRGNGRWWIYRDALITDEVRELRQENAALRRRVEELVDQQAATEARRREERNELATALAMIGATRQAAEAYKRAAETSRRATDGYKRVSEDALDSADQYKEAADQWMAVASLHLDALAEKNMPNTPEELDELGR